MVTNQLLLGPGDGDKVICAFTKVEIFALMSALAVAGNHTTTPAVCEQQEQLLLRLRALYNEES